MKKTLFLLLAACSLSTVSAKEYWVKGVTEQGGWFDADKGSVNGADSSFCWAAVDSNIMAWWQKNNPKAAAAAAKNGAPLDHQGIWNLYRESFQNITGHPNEGLEWFLNGKTPQTPVTDKGKEAGGYYEELDITVDIKTISVNSYDPAWSVDPKEGQWVWDETKVNPDLDVRLKLAQDLCMYISEGYAVSLGICGYADGVYKHAVTLWGVETDEKGYLTKMWLTDSDDAAYMVKDADGNYVLDAAGNTIPKYGTGLFSVNCKQDNMYYLTPTADGVEEWDLQCYAIQSTQAGPADNMWYMYENNDHFYEYTVVKLSSNMESVPEPASSTLSLLALAALAGRRRRK